MRALIIFTVPLLSFIVPALSHPTGAPPTDAVCETMIPDHGVDPQTTPSPYKVVLNGTKLKVNTPLVITLTSNSGRDEFKGFLVQVRMIMTSDGKPMSEEPRGEFAALDEIAKPLVCKGEPNLAMTHTSSVEKKMVKVQWTPNYPGKYKVFTTFVKTGYTFWAAVPHGEIIEVQDGLSQGAPDTDMEYDWNKLCSDMKLNDSAKPETESSNPYKVSVEPVKMDGAKGKDQKAHKSSGNSYTTHPKGLMWINITSDYGTPIRKLFVQVRKPKNPSKAYGKFILKMRNSSGVKPVNCFGGQDNAVMFINPSMSKMGAFVLWEAPQDETGDFEVVATALGAEGVFWDKMGSDTDTRKIKVEKMHSVSGKQSKSSSSSYNQITIASFGTVLSWAFFFLFSKLI